MMELELNGVARTIDLRRSGSGWAATVAGRRVGLDVRQVNGRLSLLVEAPPVAAPGGAHGLVQRFRSHEVTIDARDGQLFVCIDGQAITVADPRARRARHAGAHAASGSAGARRIVAPMPGRIVKVLVTAGQAVEARQPLIVVEAMKMENELRSPAPGTVREVAVREGMPVEAGALLLVVE